MPTFVTLISRKSKPPVNCWLESVQVTWADNSSIQPPWAIIVIISSQGHDLFHFANLCVCDLIINCYNLVTVQTTWSDYIYIFKGVAIWNAQTADSGTYTNVFTLMPWSQINASYNPWKREQQEVIIIYPCLYQSLPPPIPCRSLTATDWCVSQCTVDDCCSLTATGWCMSQCTVDDCCSLTATDWCMSQCTVDDCCSLTATDWCMSQCTVDDCCSLTATDWCMSQCTVGDCDCSVRSKTGSW